MSTNLWQLAITFIVMISIGCPILLFLAWILGQDDDLEDGTAGALAAITKAFVILLIALIPFFLAGMGIVIHTALWGTK